VLESAADLLREGRTRAGLTQADLARRAGVTQSVISAYESGRRQPSVPALLRLLRASGHALDVTLVDAVPPAELGALSGRLGRRVARYRAELLAVAERYGVRRMRVFGSVARGTEHPSSDVDLLVDLPEGTGLFALGQLRRELEDLLGASVDLVPEDGLKDAVRQDIADDLVEL
jgi:uncharacterized protein